MAKARIDMTEGPIVSKLFAFSIPILLGSIVTQLYHVADSIIVGQHIGSDALAAVSAASPLMMVFNTFFMGISTGSGVVIAQCFGSGDRERLNTASDTISGITLIFSAAISVLMLCFCRPMLRMMGTPANIFEDSAAYITIIFIGTIGNVIYSIGSGTLRGMGDSTWPFVFLCICSALNVVLDLLAVLVLEMGVAGAALATILSQGVSAVGIILRINRGNYGIHVGPRNLHVDGGMAKQIVSIGLPAGIQWVGNSLASIFVQSYANLFGSDFIAANSIVTKLEQFATIPNMAVGSAVGTFVGQNIGRLNFERSRKGINVSLGSLSALGVVLCGGLILLRRPLSGIFTDNQTVIDMAVQGLAVLAFLCLFEGIDRGLVNALRGAGKSVVPMCTALAGTFTRIPFTYLLAVRTGNFMGFFYAMLLATAVRSITIGLYYFCGGWKRAERQIREKAARGERVGR